MSVSQAVVRIHFQGGYRPMLNFYGAFLVLNVLLQYFGFDSSGSIRNGYTLYHIIQEISLLCIIHEPLN